MFGDGAITVSSFAESGLVSSKRGPGLARNLITLESRRGRVDCHDRSSPSTSSLCLSISTCPPLLNNTTSSSILTLLDLSLTQESRVLTAREPAQSPCLRPHHSVSLFQTQLSP